MSITHINQLPTNVLIHILNSLSFDDLVNNCKEVCRRWESIVLYILHIGNKTNRWKLPVPLLPSKYRFKPSFDNTPHISRSTPFYLPSTSKNHNELFNKLIDNKRK